MVPLNLVTVSIIARTLGPEMYGEYRYLIYFFTLLASFLGFGGNFFTTELAKDHFNKKLITFYQNYILLSWVGAAVLLLIVSYTNFTNTLFPSIIEIRYVWLAFLLSFLTYVSQFLESMTDSCGLTKNASIFNFLAKLLGVGVLCLLVYIVDWSDILSVFLYSIAVVLFTIIGFSIVLRSNHIPAFSMKTSAKDFKEKFSSFFKYSHPLLVLSVFTFVIGFITRWVLQFFGGSVQQGYFSFADSFSAFIIIFSNSISPLLQREFAISFNNQDIGKMKNLFQKSLLIFTSITTYLSAFIILNAAIITLLIGGKSFQDSILPTQIMLFYPIPYIANSILYATLYATGKTPLLRNVQIMIGILNLVITYFLVAPKGYFGLDMGAVGFAISLVLVTYLNHLMLLKYCASLFDLKWVTILGKYIKIIIVFIVGSFISSLILGTLLKGSLVYLLVTGVVYTMIVGFVFLKFPSLIGFSSEELKTVIKSIIKPQKNIGGV